MHWDIPGTFASSSERAFYEFSNNYFLKDSHKPFAEIKAAADLLRKQFSDLTPFIDYLMIAPTSGQDADEALALCEKIWALGNSFLNEKLAQKYFDEFHAAIPIARGI